MAPRQSFLFALIASVLLAAPAWAAEPDASIPTVTVIAPSLKKVPKLVEQFGEPFSGERLSRWTVPICPYVTGLAPEHDAFVIQRLDQIATAARIPVEPGKCAPNLVVVIAADADHLRHLIAKKGKRMLNSGSRWPIDKLQLAAFDSNDDAPVHVFYVPGLGSTNHGGPLEVGGLVAGDSTGALSNFLFGPPVVQGYLPSRLVPHVDNVFLHVFVVIDGQRVVGLSLQQIAAYVAMVTFSEVRVDQPLKDVDTITAMFADTKAGVTPPADLTFWDRAYLGALYGAPSQTSVSSQRSAMSQRIQHAIEILNVPAATQTPAPPAEAAGAAK